MKRCRMSVFKIVCFCKYMFESTHCALSNLANKQDCMNIPVHTCVCMPWCNNYATWFKQVKKTESTRKTLLSMKLKLRDNNYLTPCMYQGLL